jgi:hypothetical protein
VVAVAIQVAACLFPSFEGFGGGGGGEDAARSEGTVDAPGDVGGDAAGGPDADATTPLSCAEAVGDPDVFLCEDFEMGLNPALWSQVESEGGTSAIDTTHAHRGTHALHSHVNAVVTSATVDTAIKDNTIALPPTFYFRAFVFFPPPVAPSGTVEFLGLVQNNAKYDGIDLDLRDGRLGTGTTLPAPAFFGSSLVFPIGEWVCVEWQVTWGDAGVVRTWVDAGEVAALHREPVPIPVPQIVAVGLGAFPAQAQGPFDAWIDDVLIARRPVGCVE